MNQKKASPFKGFFSKKETSGESTRKQKHLAWWYNKSNYSHESDDSKESMYNKYFVKGDLFTTARFYNELTDREIEKIWLREIQHISEERTEEQHSYKPIHMQFKQFDESLHKAYLKKFTNEDKFKAFLSNLAELSDEVQFNAFLATLRKMKLDKETESNIMTLVALRDI